MTITRTQKAICDALKKLLREGRSFDRISVQDLVRKAGVSRSSFYNHFDSKEDVAELIIEVICDAIVGENRFEERTRFDSESQNGERARMLECCRENTDDITLLYRAGFGGQYGRTVREKLYDARSTFGYEFEDRLGNKEFLTEGPLYDMKIWSEVDNTVSALVLFCEKYSDMTLDDFTSLIEKAGQMKVTGNVIRKQSAE